MNKIKATIFIILAVLYFSTAVLSFYLKIDFLLFCLAMPWAVLLTFLMALTIHTYSGNFDCWFLGATFLNLLIFLWIFLVKPMIDESSKVPE
ncbi:hypothetical protein BH20ACI1_BH20ACI1_12220 [soil metagenome]